MQFKLKPFQKELLAQLQKSVKTNKKTILAATPGAGKTEIIIQFIKNHPKTRFLVLTHGQTTLRANFYDRLQSRGVECLDLAGSDYLDQAAESRVVVALPQSVHKYIKQLGQFDYLVVDEAHQYYGEKKKMYAKILKSHKGREILVTASHYYLEGHKIFYSRQQSLEDDMTVDFPFAMVQVGGTNIATKDFGGGEDLPQDFTLTKPTYDMVLAETKKTKNTMIVCHNTEFADKMYRKLKRAGYDVGVSHCYDDPNSEVMAEFKQGKIKTLVVVSRGNIGFDLPNLEEVIDASYTKSIVRMEQLIGRLARKGSKPRNKRYLKLIPSELTPQYWTYCSGVLALGRTDIYESWGGSSAELPVRVPVHMDGTSKARIDKIAIGKFFVNKRIKMTFGHYNGCWKQNGKYSIMMIQEAIANMNGEDPEGKKKMLIEMAKRSEPRPNQKTHPLGTALCSYMRPYHKSYDPEFTQIIKKIAPHWFVTRSDKASEKKQQLIELAKQGKPKPAYGTHPLERALSAYLKSYSASYDPEFTKTIKKLAPHWFVTRSDKANEKKHQLIDLAKKGKPRPSQRTRPLGAVLCAYTDSSHGSYDRAFTKTIKKLAPHWFVTQSDKVNKKKQQLIELAKKGEPRPNQKTHPLGLSLSNYLNPSNGGYDPEFKKTIKKLAPHWFVTQSDKANKKKQQLIELAKQGEPKPKQKTHPLGYVLGAYVRPKHESYDPEFTKTIKKLAPHWFKKSNPKAS